VRIILFTDLDGSLLDADTYSFDGARPALEELRRRSIPIVACTSKTAAETRLWLRRLEVEAPYIVESGAGVHLPQGLFPGTGGLVKLAADYAEVLKGMAAIRERVPVRGFHDMTPEEIARETGLSIEMATLAKGREFDEPFRLEGEDPDWAPKVEAVVSARGLRLSRGGRFWHLHGDTDKGKAVELVKSLYEKLWGPVRTIGAGDSAMDLPLLKAVDVPVIVGKPDGRYDPFLMDRVQAPVLSGGAGAEGWSRGVLQALELLG
jgi:mannosyl-3-phosphoglycerate phosphatase